MSSFWDSYVSAMLQSQEITIAELRMKNQELEQENKQLKKDNEELSAAIATPEVYAGVVSRCLEIEKDSLYRKYFMKEKECEFWKKAYYYLKDMYERLKGLKNE